MSTNKPRITVTVTPSLHATLSQMSDLTGNSVSSIVGELLHEASPVFERMVRVISAAKSAQADAKAEVLASLDSAQAVLEKQLGLMMDDIQTRHADMVDDLESVSRRRKRSVPPSTAAQRQRAGARAALTPPSLTGGSGTPQKAKRKG